jgi:hypothetical protein
MTDLEMARLALRRGAKLGEPIPPCACFDELRSSRNCNGVCEEVAEHVAFAIAAGRNTSNAKTKRGTIICAAGIHHDAWNSECPKCHLREGPCPYDRIDDEEAARRTPWVEPKYWPAPCVYPYDEYGPPIAGRKTEGE